MMPCSWEGNCRSGVALAMYQTSGLSTYGLTAQGREMTTPPALLIVWHTLPLPYASESCPLVRVN